MSETLDSFLGGRIKLVQPLDGYRAGIDPIFLAAAVHPKPNEIILDVGAGVGVAAISLASRCAHAYVRGLEIQPELVELACQNIRENNLTKRVQMTTGDLLSPPPCLLPNSFDHIITNPPYYETKRTRSSPIPGKAQANTETIDLTKWIQSCLKFLKPKGVFTMIHRAERLSEILGYLKDRVGELVIYPLWTTPQKPARRIIVQGRKNVRGDMKLAYGLTLHGGAEKYSKEAEAVLRHAQPILLS